MTPNLDTMKPPVDWWLATHVITSAILFAASYVLNLESGPMYFGAAGVVLSSLLALLKGGAPCRRAIHLAGAIILISVVNTFWAMEPQQTGLRWLLVLALYFSSSALVDVPLPVMRRTLELTLPWGFLLQIYALLKNLEMNLEPEKARLIWHTTSLFAGMLMAFAVTHTSRVWRVVFFATGAGFIALSGARGALVGLVATGMAWLVYLPRKERAVGIVLAFGAGIIALAYGADFLNYYSGIKVVRTSTDPIQHMMDSFAGRADLVVAGLDFSRNSPVVGAGLGNAYGGQFRFLTGLGHPHNVYVGMLIELGWAGGFAYLVACLWCATAPLRLCREHAALAFVILPLVYFMTRGFSENYGLLALGNFGTTVSALLVCYLLREVPNG